MEIFGKFCKYYADCYVHIFIFVIIYYFNLYFVVVLKFAWRLQTFFAHNRESHTHTDTNGNDNEVKWKRRSSTLARVDTYQPSLGVTRYDCKRIYCVNNYSGIWFSEFCKYFACCNNVEIACLFEF